MIVWVLSEHAVCGFWAKANFLRNQSRQSPLRFAKSPVGSPGAELLAASSARFRKGAGTTRIEVCPEGWKLARTLGKLISKSGAGGGAGLIVDYGHDHFFGNSLRVEYLQFAARGVKQKLLAI
jgi:hypothetical protein